MSDTARDVLDLEPSSVEGLDDFFAAVEPLREGVPPLAQPSRSGGATVAPGLSFKEACDFYNLKPTALRSRIKTGKVSADKVNGPNGPEWRIYPKALATPLRNPSVVDPQPSRESSGTVAEPLRDSIDSRLLDMVSDLQTKLDKANQELQAANFRVGYLENQVSERQNDIVDLTSTIKLLTDSQHKPSWWQRFKAFFVK